MPAPDVATRRDKVQSADSLWRQATTQMADDKNREAVDLLQALIRRFPQSELTDDALFLAASLLEEKLGDPAGARRLYKVLTTAFPDSRSALTAERRLQSLEDSLGAGDKGAVPLARFQDLLFRYPRRGDARSLVLAEEILRAHPQWSGSYRVRLWMADTHRRLGDYESAAPLFAMIQLTEAPASAKIQARLGEADIEILRGHFSIATKGLDSLAEEPGLSPSDQQAIEELRERADLGQLRASRVTASYALFFAMLLLLLGIARKSCASWRSFGKGLKTPPIEVIYMAPFVLLLLIMAFTGHREIGPAVALVSGGGVLITWASVNALRSPSGLSPTRALLCTSAASIATLSLCYLALHRGQLLDLLHTTLAFGPE